MEIWSARTWTCTNRCAVTPAIKAMNWSVRKKSRVHLEDSGQILSPSAAVRWCDILTCHQTNRRGLIRFSSKSHHMQLLPNTRAVIWIRADYKMSKVYSLIRSLCLILCWGRISFHRQDHCVWFLDVTVSIRLTVDFDYFFLFKSLRNVFRHPIIIFELQLVAQYFSES